MSACNEMQRAFVNAFLNTGGRNATAAAAEAGYCKDSKNPDSLKVVAYQVVHNPKIQAALLEVSKQRMRGAGVIAVSYLQEVLQDDTASTKDRMRAAVAVMDRTGMHAVMAQEVTHTHTLDLEGMKSRITQLAEQLNLDPAKLLGQKLASEPLMLEAEVTPLPDDDLSEFL